MRASVRDLKSLDYLAVVHEEPPRFAIGARHLAQVAEAEMLPKPVQGFGVLVRHGEERLWQPLKSRREPLSRLAEQPGRPSLENVEMEERHHQAVAEVDYVVGGAIFRRLLDHDAIRLAYAPLRT